MYISAKCYTKAFEEKAGPDRFTLSYAMLPSYTISPNQNPLTILLQVLTWISRFANLKECENMHAARDRASERVMAGPRYSLISIIPNFNYPLSG